MGVRHGTARRSTAVLTTRSPVNGTGDRPDRVAGQPGLTGLRVCARTLTSVRALPETDLLSYNHYKGLWYQTYCGIAGYERTAVRMG